MSATQPAVPFTAKSVAAAPASKGLSYIIYEHLEVLVPGAFFMLCLLFMYKHPASLDFRQFTIGALGVFLLAAYASGQLVQTISNTMELWWWRWVGGMPVDWVRTGKRFLLPEGKKGELERHMRVKLHLGQEFAIKEQDGGTWYFLVRQMHAMVVEGRPHQRAGYLDSMYAINRGLACGLFAVATLYLLNDPFATVDAAMDQDFTKILTGAVMFMVGVLMLYRMQRFGVQYALELYAQFMLLPMPEKTLGRSITRELTLEMPKASEIAK